MAPAEPWPRRTAALQTHCSACRPRPQPCRCAGAKSKNLRSDFFCFPFLAGAGGGAAGDGAAGAHRNPAAGAGRQARVRRRVQSEPITAALCDSRVYTMMVVFLFFFFIILLLFIFLASILFFIANLLLFLPPSIMSLVHLSIMLCNYNTFSKYASYFFLCFCFGLRYRCSIFMPCCAASGGRWPRAGRRRATGCGTPPACGRASGVCGVHVLADVAEVLLRWGVFFRAFLLFFFFFSLCFLFLLKRFGSNSGTNKKNENKMKTCTKEKKKEEAFIFFFLAFFLFFLFFVVWFSPTLLTLNEAIAV